MQLRDDKAIQDAEAIDITNAAKWYFEESDKQFWDIATDFPMAVAPFKSTWVEYQSPDKVNEKGRITEYPELRRSRTAALIVCDQVPEHLRDTLLITDGLGAILNTMSGGAYRPDATEQAFYAEQAAKGRVARWLMIMRFYGDDFPVVGKGLHMLGMAFLLLDNEGAPITKNRIPVSLTMKMLPFVKSMGEDGAASFVVEMTKPILFALSLANARNVSLEEISLPPAVAKKRTKQGKAILKFKELRIEPMRAQAKREASEGESSSKHAMHLVRGHFKDYRNSGGLFGKYKGLYWWDSQVRGSEEFGRIIKDYKLNSPPQQ